MKTIVLILLAHSAFADRVAPFFKLDDKYVCINYSGKLNIAAKLEPKKYEVFFVDPMNGQARGHMILFTGKSDIKSEGLLSDDLWVKTTMNDGDEMVTLPTKSGFTKTYQVIRESAECEAKSTAQYKPTKEELDDQKEREKEIVDANARDARVLNERNEKRKKLKSMTKEERVAYKKKESEDKAKQGADDSKKLKEWYSMPLEARMAQCKAKGISQDLDQAYCP